MATTMPLTQKRRSAIISSSNHHHKCKTSFKNNTYILSKILLNILIISCSNGFEIRTSLPLSTWTKVPQQKREHNYHSQPIICNAVPTSWSCTASINNQPTFEDDDDNIGGVMLQTQIDKKVTTSDNCTYNLASPREWMEYIDDVEKNERGGSYTVIRCDLTSSSRAGEHGENGFDSRDSIAHDGMARDCKQWNIWGQEFHIDRLQSSFCSLIQQKQSNTEHNTGCGNSVGDGELNKAVDQSRKMIDALLHEAESILAMVKDVKPELIQTAMVTLFWTPSDKTDSNSIIARGHVCFAGGGKQYDPLKYEPDPITVTIATPQSSHSTEEMPRINSQPVSSFGDLPNRYMNQPQAKLSSWCRIRRPLERPSFLKPSGVGEVILTKPPVSGEDNVDEYELLEGLTSNLFVVYKDGTIRTAPENLVLGGYVRHLILNLATSLGMKVDTENPIKVQDARDGLWVEAFATSSIRLVVPIGKVIISTSNDSNGSLERNVSFDTLWSKDMVKDSPDGGDFWRLLYNEMLKS